MSPSRAAIRDFFTENSDVVGTEWIDQIKPPFYQGSAHDQLHNDVEDVVNSLALSFGHRRPPKAQHDRCPEATVNLPEWAKTFGKEFKDWNVDVAEGVARLKKVDQDRVGAILCVGRQGKTGVPFITVVNSPVVTPVVTTSTGGSGAPEWRRIFDPKVIQLYLDVGEIHSHAIVASTASFTRRDLPSDLSEYSSMLKPVMMTPEEPFGSRLDMDDDEHGPFKMLFLPMYCDPPVGLWWPTDIGFTDFLNSISGRKPYCAFARLLCDNRTHFEEWFAAAAARPVEMAVRLEDVRPLWETLPNPQNVGDTLTARQHRVDGFLFQRSRFLWRHYCDLVLNGPSWDTSEDEATKDAFGDFLAEVNNDLPIEMGWSQLPATDQPFIPQLYEMSGHDGVTALLALFTVEDCDP